MRKKHNIDSGYNTDSDSKFMMAFLIIVTGIVSLGVVLLSVLCVLSR